VRWMISVLGARCGAQGWGGPFSARAYRSAQAGRGVNTSDTANSPGKAAAGPVAIWVWSVRSLYEDARECLPVTEG
jgi:hypothetical protein